LARPLGGTRRACSADKGATNPAQAAHRDIIVIVTFEFNGRHFNIRQGRANARVATAPATVEFSTGQRRIASVEVGSRIRHTARNFFKS